MKVVIELKQVAKAYGETEAVSPLSLSIEQGERVALVGPSGSGKTTLLNILANIVKPDTGEVLLAGKPLASFKPGKGLARKVGIMRQQFDLVDQLPVIHNVLAGRLGEWGLLKSLLSLLVPQDGELAERALARVGLADKSLERTSNLSGGQQQRVALARLLVQRPEVILADEPVSSLDPAWAEDLLSMLVSLVEEENQTLVASLHSVDFAKKHFTRIVALRQGNLYFDLPAAEVTEQHLRGLYDLKEENNGTNLPSWL